jgi:hypothetical protein
LRFAIDLTQERVTLTSLNISSVVAGLALFAILGGGLAAVWQEYDLKKVFYIGLGLPSLLTVITSSATAPRAPESPVKSKLNSGILERSFLLPAASSGDDRLKIVLPASIGYADAEAGFNFNPLSQPLSTRALTYKRFRENEVMTIPQGAMEVMVSTPLAESEWIDLPPQGGILRVIELKATRKFWSGFLYAIGAHVVPYSLKPANSSTLSTPASHDRV